MSVFELGYGSIPFALPIILQSLFECRERRLHIGEGFLIVMTERFVDGDRFRFALDQD